MKNIINEAFAACPNMLLAAAPLLAVAVWAGYKLQALLAVATLS